MNRNGKKAALVGGALGLMLGAGSAQALINPGFESPTNTTTSTDTTANGWTMFASGEPLGAGDRAAFYNNSPGGRWSYWLRTFENNGNASQTVFSVVPGTNYSLTAQMLFELGATSPNGGPGNGYDNITAANNPGNPTAVPPVLPNTGPIDSYLEIQFLDAGGLPIGTPDFTHIGPTVSLNRTWAPYSVTGVAPAGASEALLQIGWTNGGGDGGTGSQSAFADDVSFATAIPEPASLSMLALGGLTLLARRRSAKKA